MGRLICAILAATLAAPARPAGRLIDFDHEAAGALPADWETAMTKTGAAPDWRILRDATAPSNPNVLAQLSTDRTAGRFPLAIYRGATFRDGEVSVRFKPVSGSVDQAAGLVWRYLDRNNYYI